MEGSLRPLHLAALSAASLSLGLCLHPSTLLSQGFWWDVSPGACTNSSSGRHVNSSSCAFLCLWDLSGGPENLLMSGQSHAQDLHPWGSHLNPILCGSKSHWIASHVCSHVEPGSQATKSCHHILFKQLFFFQVEPIPWSPCLAWHSAHLRHQMMFRGHTRWCANCP